MVLLATLGDVVQKRRHEQGAAVVDGAHDLARDRVLGGVAPALDAGEEADGAD